MDSFSWSQQSKAERECLLSAGCCRWFEAQLAAGAGRALTHQAAKTTRDGRRASRKFVIRKSSQDAAAEDHLVITTETLSMGIYQDVALWLHSRSFNLFLSNSLDSNHSVRPRLESEQVEYSEEIIVIKRHVRHERPTEIKRRYSKGGKLELRSAYSHRGGFESVESVGWGHVACPLSRPLHGGNKSMVWYSMVWYGLV